MSLSSPPWWFCLLPKDIARGIWRRAAAGLRSVPTIHEMDRARRMWTIERHGKLRRQVAEAVAMARTGARVVWLHPADTPPPPWVAEELRAAGVKLVSSSGLAGTRASSIEIDDLDATSPRTER